MINYYEVDYLFKGKRGKELIKAATRNDAIAIAKARLNGGRILKVYQVAAPLDERYKDFKESIIGALFTRKVKTEDLISAIRQLAVMTNAGISIHDSIKEVTKATTNEDLKAIFIQVDDDLNSGKSLTEAFEAYKYELGDVTLAMVELGESTGNMSESLEKLADILEEILENRKKFKAAIRYPITVVVAIAIAFTILMIYVVPKFKDIFEKLNAELPLPTQILLFCEHAINQYGWYILAFMFGSFVLFKYMYKNNDEFKYSFDKYILKVYLIGKIIHYSSMSRFMLIFTELVRAGIPVAEALDTAVMTIENEILKEKLSSVKVLVERGSNLTDAFKQTELFEGMLIQMIQAGEQGGALDRMLGKVTDYFKSRFNEIIDNIASYIEPILIGFIAGMVLMMALGIFLPMWDMAKAVKG